jgi:hypothetical protein
VASLWMSNLSRVFRCGPFLWCFRIFMVVSMLPNEWACSFRCLAKLEVWLLFLKACLCSLNLVEKSLPV